MPKSRCSPRIRRYTGSRDTVASGIRRRLRSGDIPPLTLGTRARVHKACVSALLSPPMNAALAAAATLVASAFALSTLDRWLRRRRPHDLAWTVSLALFALGAGALWWAESTRWGLGAFRIFYLAGAILNVPWLALGTLYLLADRLSVAQERRPSAAGWYSSRLRRWGGAALRRRSIRHRRRTTDRQRRIRGRTASVGAVGSGVAALIIIVGALWVCGESCGRHRSSSRLMVGNVLIAVATSF